MVKLVRLYDAGKSSASLFGVLLATGCADIALALASRPGSQQLNAQQEAAMQAAAGQWKPAVAAAMKAHQLLLSYPKYASPLAHTELVLHLNKGSKLQLVPFGNF